MKVGDKKQATILGIFAVFAVGMLGKTALGSFSGPAASQPLQVRDLGGPGTTPKPEQAEGATPASSPDQSKTGAGPALTPAKEPPATIMRDAFSKPEMPAKTKPFTQPAGMQGQVPQETQTPVDPNGPGLSMTGGIGSTLPPGSQAKTNQTGDDPSGKKAEPAKKVEKPKPTVRYSGYVEAGSAMGVISIDGKTMSVQIGEMLDGGYRIESITSDHIVIRNGKTTKTIYIGKETQF